MAVLPVPGRPCTSTLQAAALLVKTLKRSLICGFLAGHFFSRAVYASCTLVASLLLLQGCCAMLRGREVVLESQQSTGNVGCINPRPFTSSLLRSGRDGQPCAQSAWQLSNVIVPVLDCCGWPRGPV
jgi:hypothetical protein